MTDAARSDYSWSFPNRRFIDGGLYLPSIRSEGIDAIAVIIDTSGSLPAQTHADFWAEVREVATEIQPESVIILQVDAALQDVAEYAACDLPDEIVIKGRGGTDFRPGFEWLDEHGIQPSVCLYLTDMLCSSYPDTEPHFPVIWANYSNPPDDWNRGALGRAHRHRNPLSPVPSNPPKPTMPESPMPFHTDAANPLTASRPQTDARKQQRARTGTMKCLEDIQVVAQPVLSAYSRYCVLCCRLPYSSRATRRCPEAASIRSSSKHGEHDVRAHLEVHRAHQTKTRA